MTLTAEADMSGIPIKRSELCELVQTQPGQFLVRVGLVLLFTFGSVAGVVRTHGCGKLISQALLGIILAHGTELSHQCLHKTGTGILWVDNIIGTVLSMPTGTAFHFYKFFHHWHHRFNGTDKDLESFGYTYALMASSNRVLRFLGFCRYISMIDHYAAAISRMSLAVFGGLSERLRRQIPAVTPASARRIQVEYVAMSGMVLLLWTGATILRRTHLLLDLWIIPVFSVWGPVHAMIELPEHWGTTRPCGDVFFNTRSIRASAFARWFTNNNCAHIEHHLCQSIPMQHLQTVRQLLIKHGLTLAGCEHTYATFYISFFKSLWFGTQGSDRAQTGHKEGCSIVRSTNLN